MKVWKILSRIEISPAFTAFVCAYYYFDPASTFAAFFSSVLAHECGHLIALKAAGVRVHKLRFTACGACILTEPMGYTRELLVAAAGPAVNVLLILLLLHREPEAAVVNMGLLMYNLLPFYPLDGGRILRCLLRLLLNEKCADCIQRLTGAVCMILLWGAAVYLSCVWHAGLWPVLVCALLTVRVAGSIVPDKSFFTNKRVDKSHFAC